MNPQDLSGESLETPDGSQPEITTGNDGAESATGETPQPRLEEVAFNNLKGSTQERIRTLAQRANQASTLQAEVEQMKAQLETMRLTSMQPQSQVNPDIQQAVSRLDEFGVATKDFVSKQIEAGVNQKLSGLVYKMEMDRLEGRHGGQDGLPAFDRAEYEAYLNANPQYRNYEPEDVYNKMYEDDIFDAKVKGMGGRATSKQTPNLRASRTRVQEETMTPEYVEKRLQQPDGRAWYEQNKDKINAVVSRASSTE